jgi:drug/metabolite transporter (DMT)-like permease
MNNIYGMWGEIAGILSAISAAVGSLQVRALGANVHPVVMNATRCILASFGFALIWWVNSRAAGDWSNALPFLLFAVICGIVVGDSLYFRAIVRLGPGRATPIAMSYPLPTAVLAAIIFSEPLPAQKTVGIIVGIFAIWLVATEKLGTLHESAVGRANWIGVGMAGAASLCWSFSVLALRPALALVPLDFANLARMGIAGLILGLFSFRLVDSFKLKIGTVRSGSLLVGLGITALLTSYFLAVSISLSGASVAALMSSMTPIFAAPLAWLFFNEEVGIRVITAIGLGILGIALVAFSS